MKRVTAGKSSIEGRGLIAQEDIKKGDFIAFIKGPIVRRVEKTKEAALAMPDLIGLSGIFKTTWIDPQPPFKYLNHSCNPSASVTGKKMRALRDIKKGGEVTFDYSTVVGNPLWEMRCFCHEKNCRKIIQSVQKLPPSLFQKYSSFMRSNFKNIYLRYNKNAH